MKRVNLKNYPKFWNDVIGRINAHIDASAPIDGNRFKLWMKDWYGINVYVMPSSLVGEVYMLDEEYTMFALRWS